MTKPRSIKLFNSAMKDTTHPSPLSAKKKEISDGSGRSKRPTGPKGRQVRNDALEEVRALLGNRLRRPDVLIEHLHLLQDHYGYLSTDHLAALAEEVGRELAKRQVVVVCGGLTGVMAAVCRGAKAEGGTTIGILPGTDPNASSPHVDYPIMTGMGYARNVIVVKNGRAEIEIDPA